MRYLIQVDEQYFHIVGEKGIGIECKFWILWTQVLDILKLKLMKKAKCVHLGDIVKLLVHSIIVEEQLYSTIIYNQNFERIISKTFTKSNHLCGL